MRSFPLDNGIGGATNAVIFAKNGSGENPGSKDEQQALAPDQEAAKPNAVYFEASGLPENFSEVAVEILYPSQDKYF